MSLKNLIGKTSLIFFAVVLLLTSCENFMSGSFLTEEIEKKVNYEKAPYAVINVSKVDVDDTGTLTPAGDISNIKVAVGKINLSYTASSTYYFLYWMAVDENGHKLDSSAVRFDNPEAAKTSATIFVTSAVKILAVTSPVPRAIVNFSKSFDASGIVSSSEINSFKVDEEFTFTFKPSDNYQFIKWQSSNDCVEIIDADKLTGKAIAKKNGNTTITAVCVPRPQVKGGNTNPTATDSICKDTNIIIYFDRDLDAENDLSKITLYLNGNQLFYGENEPFGEPYFFSADGTISYSQVIIPAHSKNTLDVGVGQTMAIRVVLPDSLYSIDPESKSKVYLCPEGKFYSWTYKINDNTSNQAKISVKADSNAGILTGKNGTFNYGKTVEYTFKPTSSAQFLGWNVIAVPLDCVEVNKSSENGVEKLSFKVNGAGDIEAEALTAIRPSVDITYNISPAMTKTGVPLDSEFRMKFNVNDIYSLDSENLLKDTNIYCDTLDIGDYFEKSFENNILTIKAKDNISKILELKDILFNTGSKLRIFNVSIPAASVFYKTQHGNEIIMNKDFNYSYCVNSNTTKSAKIKFIPSDSGRLKINGVTLNQVVENTYSIGDKIQLYFEVSSDSYFNGWTKTGSLNAIKWSFTDNENTEGYDSKTKIATATIYVEDEADLITISPNTSLIPYTQIEIDSNNEITQNLVPSKGSYTKRLGDSFNIEYSPVGDYYFTEWTVSLNGTKLTQQQINEYFDFNIESSSQNLKIKKLPNTSTFKFVPSSTQRPKIISNTPSYDAAGAYRDSRIQVMFSKEMNESSIYFDAEELAGIAESNKLKSASGKVYGYIDPVKGIIYKNITIVKNSITNPQNLLANFGEPYFESPNTLIIPVNKSNLPKSGSDILVTISHKMCYLVNGKEIPLTESLQWHYRVNSLIDGVIPTFEEFSVYKNANQDLIPESTTLINVANKDELKKYYLSDNKIKVLAKIFDEGSGPESFQIKATRLMNDAYKSVSEASKSINVEPIIMDNKTTGWFGTYNSTSDDYSAIEVDLSSLEDGVHKLDFIAADANGNTTIKSCFIVLDRSVAITDLSAEAGNAKINLNWYTPSDVDTVSIEARLLKLKEINLAESYEPFSIKVEAEDITPGTLVSKIIPELKEGRSYKFDITIKDIFGNSNTVNIERSTKPSKPSIRPVIYGSYGRVNLQWNYDSSQNLDGHYIYFGPDKDNLEYHDDIKSNECTLYPELKGIKNYFKIVKHYKDTDGTEILSDSAEGYFKTTPCDIPDNSVKVTSGYKQISISWDNSEYGIWDYVRLYYSTTGSIDRNTDSFIDVPYGTNSYTFLSTYPNGKGILNGQKINFELMAMNETGSSSHPRSTYGYTLPGTIEKSSLKAYVDDDYQIILTYDPGENLGENTTVFACWEDHFFNDVNVYKGASDYDKKNSITIKKNDYDGIHLGRTYYIRVYGLIHTYYEPLLSPDFAEIYVPVMLSPVKNVQITKLANASLKLDWASSSQCTSVKIYYQKHGTSEIKNSTTTANTFTITGMSTGTWDIWLIAEDGNGNQSEQTLLTYTIQ